MDTRLKEDGVGSTNSSRITGKLSFIAVTSLNIVAAISFFAALLLFYSFYYPVHQDLAGSALSGRLSVVLGDAFHNYGIYFPPVEKIWFSLATQISASSGARLDLVVIAMTYAALSFSAALAYKIRRTTVGASLLFFVIPLAVLTILPILFKNVFGLREHLVVAGLWPMFSVSTNGQIWCCDLRSVLVSS